MSWATTVGVLEEVLKERERQDEKFPDQHLPNGTGGVWVDEADDARAACDQAAEAGKLTWRHILDEETMEAWAEEDDAKLRAELVQVAAVVVRWIEDIDSRST